MGLVFRHLVSGQDAAGGFLRVDIEPGAALFIRVFGQIGAQRGVQFQGNAHGARLYHPGIVSYRLGCAQIGFHDTGRVLDQPLFPFSQPGLGLDQPA